MMGVKNMRTKQRAVTNIRLSQKVELVIGILKQCPEDARFYQSLLDEAEAQKVNLEHELEGVGVLNRQPPKFDQRAVLATKLQAALVQRRKAKDGIRANGPLLDFVVSEQGIRAINQLSQTLGKLRDVEKKMDGRVFRERVAGREKAETEQSRNIDKLIKDYKKKRRMKY